jgi:long-chain acyl-CoA synthetase
MKQPVDASRAMGGIAAGRIFVELKASAMARPNKVAYRMRRAGKLTQYTYAELFQAAERDAARLAALGLEPGDRIALFSENCPEWMRSYLAIARGAMTAVPIDRQLREPDVKHILDTSEARALIVSHGALAVLSDDCRRELKARGVVVLDHQHDLALCEKSAERARPLPADALDDRDPTIASLLFTSGTTGRPKGVMLTHENLLWSSITTREKMQVDERDELLSVLPLHHTYPFSTELIALQVGVSITHVEELRGDLITDTMRETGTTILIAVPRLLDLFATGVQRKIDASGAAGRAVMGALGVASRAALACGVDVRRQLFRRVHQGFGGKLRVVCSGAAPLAPATWKALDGFGFNLLEGYGLTETSPIVCCHTVETRKPGTVGTPNRGVEVRIVNPNINGEGELAVRGRNVMRGYFRDPEATRAVLRDGWFHTGDMARVTPDGDIMITGRVKDLIVTQAGKNVSPDDVEARYGKLPEVKDLCVVGLTPSGGFGEQVWAAVVVNDEAFPPSADLESKRHAIEQRLDERGDEVPEYMRIQGFDFLSALPQTTTMKVKRHEVRALLQKERATSRPSHATDKSHPVMGILAELTRNQHAAITLDAALQFDLGFDSLDRVELLAAIEKRLGVHLSNELAPRLHRVRDVVDAIEHGKPAAALGGEAEPLPIPEPRGDLGLNLFRGWAESLYRLSSAGLENLPDGPMILCPNHESHLDVFFVASQLPAPIARQLICFAKREHFESPWTRAIAQFARAVPVDRDGDVRSALATAAEALAQKRPLLIHPEGTRTKNGELGVFRAGAARLAIEHSVPLVPVRIHGSFEVYPHSRRLPRPLDWKRLSRHKILVQFGRPLQPPFPAGADLKTAADELTRRLRNAVAAM